MKDLRIALNFYMLTLLAKLSKARFIAQQVGDNPTVFVNSGTELALVLTCITDLEQSASNAESGDTYKVGIRDQKEKLLVTAMNDLVLSVQKLPGLTEEMILLAGMDIRKTGVRTSFEGFEVTPGNSPGEVKLRVKAQKDTFYKWEYCLDPIAANQWVIAESGKVSSVTVTVPPGFYWFRVVFVQPNGEHEHEAVKFAVN